MDTPGKESDLVNPRHDSITCRLRYVSQTRQKNKRQHVLCGVWQNNHQHSKAGGGGGEGARRRKTWRGDGRRDGTGHNGEESNTAKRSKLSWADQLRHPSHPSKAVACRRSLCETRHHCHSHQTTPWHHCSHCHVGCLSQVQTSRFATTGCATGIEGTQARAGWSCCQTPGPYLRSGHTTGHASRRLPVWSGASTRGDCGTSARCASKVSGGRGLRAGCGTEDERRS